MGSKGARKHAAQKQDHESSEPTEAGFRQLIPDGDIILLIGPKQEKIQISSHLLCITSPVFKAMLKSDFKEGKALCDANKDPVEIELPEDSPDAV
ncbi:hypothetical protein CEP52_014300 [Fusarium oligoseptatum]|uniref:BTB domain-containing protein n=1 Tax=Fusarium oligoseptatum TaxID=2604345 RepID=A0A428SNF4_9HYPO|nr:hypothetical protein CEP52_014300 [Fusarium oligoseptatum]